ncbi:exodeoxyribonuclease VII large subunit [Paracoccus thiocyanatus]|uniref:exodeoxyribonuclease VII large subunit n=1 Tax=Paracoccus thiocyanatus TaxID=34006 RepID=UPI002162B0EF|nr:exodeoxyribonuclease VII large subunit [Paracoccus thiocyanatus]
MELFEDTPASNAHEFTVSEISGAVKRVIEGEFGRVRVRGEIGRVSRPSSGHLYFDLKDERACIAAVTWKGQAARLSTRPEEGIEVIATGRLTTFPGQSKYQLIVDEIEPAGAGALMMMLEKRRKALAAEGLFDESRKRPLPYLPRVIGVVTSPSGAVIRDILHRLRDRFPTRVLIWPVAVQGEGCAPQVTAAIQGFNALPQDRAIPPPDLIIVARGGGSLEDLWGFNEEAVVRAAAESAIPLISAVGHETDTTLIDFAADRRAPTPTAAAEMAVPVRAELAARLAEIRARTMRAAQGGNQRRRQRLADLGRAPWPAAGADRSGPATLRPVRRAAGAGAARFRSRPPRPAECAAAVAVGAARHAAQPARGVAGAGAAAALCLARLGRSRAERLADLGSRLERARARMLADAGRQTRRDRDMLDRQAARLAPPPRACCRRGARRWSGWTGCARPWAIARPCAAALPSCMAPWAC